jgi:hypothetical protein
MEDQELIGITSAAVALCALAFSLWQASQARKHNRLSVKPHLTTWVHRDDEKGRLVLDLINNGLGPAIIEHFFVTLDGVSLGHDSLEGIEKLLQKLFPDTPYGASYAALEPGYAMASKERCTIVDVRFHNKPFPTAEVVEKAIKRGRLEVTYRSFYEEQFRMSSGDASNMPLRAVALESGPFD